MTALPKHPPSSKHVATSLETDPSLPILQLLDTSKRFPGVVALDAVNLGINASEIHGLVGENGAGKSTLLKVISGVHRADSGQYQIDGVSVEVNSPRDAFAHGIRVVHQERNLVPTFTVAENVLLERIVGGRPRWLDRRKLHQFAEPFLDMVRLDVSLDMPVVALSGAQQQLVEIARALSSSARILLLDEPTAAISKFEADALLLTLRRLRDGGVSVLYISHKLDEVETICDVVTVLRDGRNAGPTQRVSEVDRNELIARMIGRSGVADMLPNRDLSTRDVVLDVENYQSPITNARVSFSLREGEILGWYGLVGAGRSELARAVVGADRGGRGLVRLRGRVARIRSIHDALHRWGVGYVTENRQTEGLFLQHSVRRNVAATVWAQLVSPVGSLSSRQEARLADDYRKRLNIRVSNTLAPVVNLSGGNRQKVSLAKWLAASPSVLFIDEPTVGIDVGTRNEFHLLIRRLAEEGLSVVLISSDMVEMVRLADRIMVFRGGAVVGERVNTRVLEQMSPWIMGTIVGSQSDI